MTEDGPMTAAVFTAGAGFGISLFILALLAVEALFRIGLFTVKH